MGTYFDKKKLMEMKDNSARLARVNSTADICGVLLGT